jgi:hypothetical protein
LRRENVILIPTKSAQDWKVLLADPEKHWRRGYSAMSLAYCWEKANGFPKRIQKALSSVPELGTLEPLLAIPEHKVNLPGGRAASQNDLFVLARSPERLACIMIEGKVSEPFGPLVSEWYVDPSSGKVKRLEFLCQILGLTLDQVQDVRYQLLHRTASAIIEAKRYHARYAVMLVHSFSSSQEWLGDYRKFASLHGVDAKPGKVAKAAKLDGVELYLGWVSDTEDYGEPDPTEGTVAARKCAYCGHHEIGIETDEGEFVPVRPGTNVKVIGEE